MLTTTDTFRDGDYINMETETFVISNLEHDYYMPALEFTEVNVTPYTKPKNRGKRLHPIAKRPKRRTKTGWIEELHPTKGWRKIAVLLHKQREGRHE